MLVLSAAGKYLILLTMSLVAGRLNLRSLIELFVPGYKTTLK